ncbi:hypothetical protein EDB84DRAFT_1437725 [Lactarius hengduanensis]|nr:hypothetical protein EDB84DRAFT_1437725 [Lactarius hengduanensis]
MFSVVLIPKSLPRHHYCPATHGHVITTDWRAPADCTVALIPHPLPPILWYHHGRHPTRGVPIHIAGAIPTKSCALIATQQRRYHRRSEPVRRQSRDNVNN